MNYSQAASIYVSMIKETPTLHRSNMIANLMSNGFDVNSIYYRQETPLHYAVCGPSISVALELIKKGANINAQDAAGCAPLHEAVSTSNAEAICMLLYYGADVDVLNRNEHTPFLQGIQTFMCMYNLDVAGWLLNHYDKFRGSFPSMENYLYLFRIPFNQLGDEAKKVRLVTQIWSKFDNDAMLWEKSMFLALYIVSSSFSTPLWKNGLYTMLGAPDVGELMAYKFSIQDESEIPHFEDVFSAFLIRDLDRNDRASLISLWLSFGARVCLLDIIRVYSQYGMGEELLLLIFATPVPLLTLVFGLEEYFDYKKEVQAVLVDVICNVRRAEIFSVAAGFICKSLVYFSWRSSMRMAIEAQCHECMTEDDQEVLKALEKTPKVGSLVEKCRNLVARSIQKSIFSKGRKIRRSMEYHQAVNGLELTRDVKNILNFKRPLYI